ncbi:MAG: hypothetical protein AMXMBFR64_39480 [Myxococcales bacterium]
MGRTYTKQRDTSKGTASAEPEHTVVPLTDACPLAVSLAQAAVYGGVAADVVRLLTGGGTDGGTAPDAAREFVWAGNEPEPVSSAPTTMEAEDAGELSRLLKTVRERRTTPRRRPKPVSS